MVARSGTATLSNSGGSATTTATATLASTTPGDYNIVVVSANTSGATSPDPAQTLTDTTGRAWTNITSSWKSGSPSHRLTAFGKFYVSGDPAPTATIAASGNIENAGIAYSGVDTTTPVVSGEAQAQAQGSSSTAFATPSVTTAASRWLVSAAGDRTASTTWTGTDSLLLTGAAANAANLIVQDSNGSVVAGTYSRTFTASAATSIGNALIFALNPASGTSYSGASAMTSASSLGATTTATDIAASGMVSASSLAASTGMAGSSAMASSSSLTGSATAARPAASGMTSASSLATISPIVRFITSGAALWSAHRDGNYATYGEETLEGYQATYAQYSKAILEISVWDTSDGVYVCSHDSTTGRVFSGTNRTITSTTWATFSPNGTSTTGRPTTLVGGNPMRRLEEVLDAFPSAFFMVENKHGTNQAVLSDLLEAHAAGRWMFKGPYNDTANANTAAGRGAPMWLYFYPSQLSSLSTAYSAVSGAGVPVLFGLGDYSAAPVPVQSDANTFFTFTAANGIRTLAHILGTTTQKTTADSQAATAGAAFTGYQVGAFPTVGPADGSTSSMASASSLAGSATASLAATSGMTSASSLSVTTTATAQAASGMTSASSLTGTTTASLPAVQGMTSTSTLAGAGTASVAATSAMTSGSALTGTATLAAAPAAGMTSASTLSSTATAALPASSGMTSGSALTGTAAASLAATSAMVSASGLTGATTAVRPAGTGMVSGSSLGQATAASLPATGSMVSGSVLAGQASLTVPVISAMTSGSALTGVSGAMTGASTMVSTSVLSSATTAGLAGGSGMASASTLSSFGARTTPGAVGMVSSSTLNATTALVSPMVAGMASGSVLGTAAAAGTAGSSAMTSGSLLAGDGARLLPTGSGMVSQSGLFGQPALATPGVAGMTSGSVFGQVALAQLAAASSMQSASVLAGTLQPVTTSVGPLSVRLGPARWACQLGPSRWAVRLGVVDVRASSQEMVPVQVKAPVALDSAQLRFCTNTSDEVPDAADWQPLVVPDGTSWSPGEWVTLLAPVGPGLPVGTLYIIPRVTTADEDFREVAGYRQVRA